jgi:hypothetical protein
MKVDKLYFLNAQMYLKRIDHCPLEKLDLSDLFEGDLTQSKKDFALTGLSNVDYITSDYTDRYPNIKRKFTLNSPLRVRA